MKDEVARHRKTTKTIYKLLQCCLLSSVHHSPQDRAVQTQIQKPTSLQLEDAWLRCSSWKHAMLLDFPAACVVRERKQDKAVFISLEAKGSYKGYSSNESSPKFKLF